MTLRHSRIRSGGGGQQRTKKAKVEAVVAKREAAESTTSASELEEAATTGKEAATTKRKPPLASMSSTSTQGTEVLTLSRDLKSVSVKDLLIPCIVSLEGEVLTITMSLKSLSSLGKARLERVSTSKEMEDMSSHHQAAESTEDDIYGACGGDPDLVDKVHEEMLEADEGRAVSVEKPSPKSQKAYKKFLKEGIKKKVADHPWRAGKGSVGREMREIDKMGK